MRRKIVLKEFEKGQVIIIVAIAMVALITMAALIVDGAILMSHRRTAQAAADAAALAGAEYLCPNVVDDLGGITAAKSAAETEARYYVGLNNAVVVEPITFPEVDTIHVEASVDSPPFFARILNETELSANAVAEASCTPLSTGAATLPIVYPCRDLNPDDGVVECTVDYYDFDHDDEWNRDNGRYVILHDTDAQNPLCDDPVYDIHCLNVVAMGDKGWVALDKDSNKQDMEDWISGAVKPPEISAGFWLTAFEGASVNWYKTLTDYEGDTFLVPIYNSECSKTMPSDECPSLFMPGDNDDLTEGYGAGRPSYRIAGFGLFVLTCVQDQQKDACPYRADLEDYGFDALGNNSIKTVEGYFIEGTYPTGGGDGEDYGLYTVHLRR